MSEHHLSKRLSAIASFIPVGARLADIGTDHAYLPIHLALQGKISSAVASDLNSGPVSAAKTHIKRLQLESVIEVRQGDGLEVLLPDEVDVVVLAGMGGVLITEILSKGAERLHGVSRLICQPNVGSHLVRMWMVENGWELKDEEIIAEKDKIYEILMAEPGDGEGPYRALSPEERARAILMGPYLVEKRSPAFIKKWQQEFEHRKEILQALRQSAHLSNAEKRELVEQEIKLIQGGIE